MVISTNCECGFKINALDELGGMRINCPSCGQTLTVPPAQAECGPCVSVSCQCGQPFQANATLAGKAVTCSACGAEIVVPQLERTARGASGSTSSVDQPGDSIPSPLIDAGKRVACLANTAMTEVKSAVEGTIRQLEGRENAADSVVTERDALITVTACICIVHGLTGVSLASVAFSESPFSLQGLAQIGLVLASGGILVTGAGLITKKSWAIPLGTTAAIVHFVALITSIIATFHEIANAASIANQYGVNQISYPLIVFGMVCNSITWSIAPALLVYSLNRTQ